MRVVKKEVKLSDNFKPVLLITLEFPLSLETGLTINGKDFMQEFYEELKKYEDENEKKLD